MPCICTLFSIEHLDLNVNMNELVDQKQNVQESIMIISINGILQTGFSNREGWPFFWK